MPFFYSSVFPPVSGFRDCRELIGVNRFRRGSGACASEDVKDLSPRREGAKKTSKKMSPASEIWQPKNAIGIFLCAFATWREILSLSVKTVHVINSNC